MKISSGQINDFNFADHCIIFKSASVLQKPSIAINYESSTLIHR